MSGENQTTGIQSAKPIKNFAAIALERDILFNVPASLPKFDTSLQMRSPSAVSSSSVNTSDMPQTDVPVDTLSFNGKKRSSRSVDDSAEDILEQSECVCCHKCQIILSLLIAIPWIIIVQFAHK